MPYQLVVLITDGLSYDDGYEGTHGEADTRRSIAELRAHHIACLCISVGSGADDMRLRRVFGEAAFLRTDDSEHVEIGRAAWRARGWKDVEILGVAGSLKKKQNRD